MRWLSKALLAVALAARLLPAAGPSLNVCPPIAAKLLKGDEFAAIFVLTHQTAGRIPLTLRRLTENSIYKNMPVVLLNAPTGEFGRLTPDRNRELVGRATVHTSLMGEVSGISINSPVVHVAGGACGVCLTRTLHNLIRDFEKSDRTDMRIVLHKDLIYPEPSQTGYPDNFMRELFIGRTFEAHNLGSVRHSQWSLGFRIPVTGGTNRRVIVEIATGD